MVWAANLLCAQANSAFYAQRDGKWVVAHGLQGEGLVHWLGRWYVCVLHRGSSCSPSRVMDGRIMRHDIISSCQSAATSEIVKHCCSSLVSSAITNTQTFTFLSFLRRAKEQSRPIQFENCQIGQSLSNRIESDGRIEFESRSFAGPYILCIINILYCCL